MSYLQSSVEQFEVSEDQANQQKAQVNCSRSHVWCPRIPAQQSQSQAQVLRQLSRQLSLGPQSGCVQQVLNLS